MTPKRILITGSAGRVGQTAVHALIARSYLIRGYDLRATPGIAEKDSIIGTLTDADALSRACEGIDTIIHMAATPDDLAYPRPKPPNDQDNFLSGLVPNNIVGLYHLLEAARKQGVKRLLLASSAQVMDTYLVTDQVPVGSQQLPRPRYLYACTKVFLEAIGQVYAREHGLEILCLRIGWCPRDAAQIAEIRASESAQDVYLSPADSGRFFVCAVEKEQIPTYGIYYITSKPLHHVRYDLTETTALLGFEPQDQWPMGIE